MNIVLYDWAASAWRRMNALGFQHQQQLEGDFDKVVEITKIFYNNGLNVMWLHQPDGLAICVDTKAFQQR